MTVELDLASFREGHLTPVLFGCETEVLALLADARSNAEIAGALYIGEATVKTHVSRILQKLGARDRANERAAQSSLAACAKGPSATARW